MNYIKHLTNNKKIAVLISGRGSNLHALIKRSLNKEFNGTIGLVISDKRSAPGIDYAKKYNIHYQVIEPDNFLSEFKFYEKLLNIVKSHDIDIICLAGFMKILSKEFIHGFNQPIINIHPSLLPKYQGLDTHRRVIDNKETFTGCTVHYVIEELDAGEIILQKSLKIKNNDTAESLSLRVLNLEHSTYSEALKKIID